MIPVSHLALALKERGHDVHFITIENSSSRTRVPALFGKMNIPYIMTEGPESGIEHMKTDEPGDPNERFIEEWRPHCFKAVKDLAPDLVVSEFFSRNGAIAADELGIPSVINVGMPLEVFIYLGMFKVLEPSKARSCCGCLCFS